MSYTQLETLKNLATLAKYNQIEKLQEEFTSKRKAFNIALLDYLQNEFSDNVQVLDCLESGSFSIRVINSYWSDYRQTKLDRLEDDLKGLVRTLEVIPEFVPEYATEDGTTTEAQNIFKVTACHRY